MSMLLLIGLALQAMQPAMPAVPGPAPHATTPEGERLGREVAENGMLAGLLPLVAQRDIESLITDNPSLTPAEQAQLRSIGQRVFAAGLDRLMTATGHAFAERMTVPQLRAVAAFYRTPGARALRGATPAAMIASLQAVAGVDLKRDVRAAFCAETRKLCEEQR